MATWRGTARGGSLARWADVKYPNSAFRHPKLIVYIKRNVIIMMKHRFEH